MNKRVNKRKIKQIFVFKIIMNNFLEIDFAIKTTRDSLVQKNFAEP